MGYRTFNDVKKTYATIENAVAAARKVSEDIGQPDLSFLVVAGEGKAAGRFIPVFVGQNANDVIFHGFCWTF